MYNQNDYQLNYEKLTFEDKLRVFRMQYIVDYIADIKSQKILEIGCGNDPLFLYFDDYEIMDIVEPGELFYEYTKSKIGQNTRVSIINNFIELAHTDLKNDYDIILIGGFLHEIDNPEEVLKTIKKIANPNTIVITFVPNANSFHRLLALEAGLIQSNYEFSENDKLFGRRNIFNAASIAALFTGCGYQVIKTDSYFVKPFSHEQMEHLVDTAFFSTEILNGLSKMIKYMPDMGCEIFLSATNIF